MVIGRDINVVAGMCTLIGHNTASASLWSVNYFMTGAIATVMGGVLTMIGGNNIGANWLQVQCGTMVNFGTCKLPRNIDMPFYSHTQNGSSLNSIFLPISNTQSLEHWSPSVMDIRQSRASFSEILLGNLELVSLKT